MINIAICDDDEKQVHLLHDKFYQILKDYGIAAKISRFASPVKFMENLRETSYDLVFLDIEMSPINGFEIADYLTQHKEFTRIVFISSHDINIARKSIRYSPIAFISKNHFEQELKENMDIIFDKLKLMSSHLYRDHKQNSSTNKNIRYIIYING